MAYQFRIDPRAEVTRKQLRQIAIRDLGECSRWHLHLSDAELDFLEFNNPGFNMDAFIKAPESKAFRVAA